MNIPPIQAIGPIQFTLPKQLQLSNQIPVYIFNDDKNPILKLDIVFDAGRWTEEQKLAADAMAALSKSGTNELSSFEINEEIDQLGATLKIGTGFNTCTLSISCLSKFLEPCLELALTCLTDIVFPENELQIFKKNTKAKLLVNNEKTDYLSGVIFRETIFGKEHPYGYRTNNERIEQIDRNEIIRYYQSNLLASNCTVFIAGDVNENCLNQLESVLSRFKNTSVNNFKPQHIIQTDSNLKIREKKAKSTQASLTMGKILFNKQNKDYGNFILLNTIFGGYFGSRLMSNIREDKGLTYGIYSMLNPLKHDGFWAIYTDTNIDKLDICIQEIEIELDRLQNELISENEIQLARNYLLGRFLKRTDGAFNLMETFKSYIIEGVDIQHFGTFIEDIKNADAKLLQNLAQKYLSLDTMHQVIVG